MPRSSLDPVLRDSGAGLWQAMFDGIIDEEDVTASGRLRPSIDGNLPAPSPSNWARDMQASLPYGRQQPPFTSSMRSDPPTTPEHTSISSPVAPGAPMRPTSRRTPLTPVQNSQGVRERIYKAELQWEEDQRPGQAAREGMLRRFVALAREVESVLAQENQQPVR